MPVLCLPKHISRPKRSITLKTWNKLLFCSWLDFEIGRINNQQPWSSYSIGFLMEQTHLWRMGFPSFSTLKGKWDMIFKTDLIKPSWKAAVTSYIWYSQAPTLRRKIQLFNRIQQKISIILGKFHYYRGGPYSSAKLLRKLLSFESHLHIRSCPRIIIQSGTYYARPSNYCKPRINGKEPNPMLKFSIHLWFL